MPVTEQSESLSLLKRIAEDETDTFSLDVNELSNKAYDRMPRIQRFLIDKDCAFAYTALSDNEYTLEMLIEEGQGLYIASTEESVRTSRFNNFFEFCSSFFIKFWNR